MRSGVALALLSIALVACNVARQGTRLAIETGPHPPGACPGIDSASVTMDRADDVAIFLDATTSTSLAIEWPVGFSAWQFGDETILYAGDGYEALHADGVIVKIGGTAGGPGEPFHVCSVGLRTYN